MGERAFQAEERVKYVYWYEYMMAQLYIGLVTGEFITKAQPPGAGFPLPHPVVQSNHRIVPVTCSTTVGRGEGAAMEAPYTVLIS